LRFVDASVFVHAYLKPRRTLSQLEREIRDAAKEIVRRIQKGEKVALTIVQLAEIANILEKYMPPHAALDVEKYLLYAPHVAIYGVDLGMCREALRVAETNYIGFSDAVAYVAMLRSGIREIYSFDRDFDKLSGIKRVVG